jgi:hypothetical protein
LSVSKENGLEESCWLDERRAIQRSKPTLLHFESSKEAIRLTSQALFGKFFPLFYMYLRIFLRLAFYRFFFSLQLMADFFTLQLALIPTIFVFSDPGPTTLPA